MGLFHFHVGLVKITMSRHLPMRDNGKYVNSKGKCALSEMLSIVFINYVCFIPHISVTAVVTDFAVLLECKKPQ